MIRVDGEGAINTEWFESRIAALGIILDTTGAGEAVVIILRKIRHIKESIRAIMHTLLYPLTDNTVDSEVCG